MASKDSEKAADFVYTTIRNRILNLEYKPGRGLSAAALSQELKVSRSPVREALLRLSLESLVEIFPQSGSRVSLIDLNKVTEERFLRKNMEIAAVVEFISNSPVEYLDEMQRFIDRQIEAWNKQDIVDFLKYDDAFHGVIFKAIDKYRCWELITSFCPNEHRLRLLSSWVIAGTRNSVISNHQDLVAALERKDREEALRIEQQHLSRISEESAKLVAVYPSIFRSDTSWIPAEQTTVQPHIRSFQDGNENFLTSLRH
ncbi:MAG: GntR family transcriptional regulator [Sphaerochaetaceae bacterium]|nr:GntR family transcriptional regulator [Sphaerochaetaceae bacterium]